MLIKSLDRMEAIVKNNRNLRWLGWDVFSLEKNNTAWTKSDGVFIDGRWYTQKKFELTTEGWEIPNKFVR